ncbi:MAG: hypothetical protein M1818_008363 [Claussenomyces sp. TS43310]|nr:MAG: hypothetical protein M1818_008363 [Claussenomyces sp. TS43310]
MDVLQHIRPHVKLEPAQKGNWNLPSVKDILHVPDPQLGDPTRSPAATPSPLCATCLSKDHKVQLRPEGSCPSCTYEQTLVPARQVTRPFSDRSVTGHVSGESNRGRPPCRSYRPQTVPIHPPSHAPIQTPLASPLTPTASSPAFTLGFRPSLPGIPPRASVQIPPNTHSRPPAFTAHTLSAAKKASNDRHKLSEKHRRDGQGSFVRAGYEMRAGLNPGVLSDCRICMAESPSRRGSTALCPSSVSSSQEDSIMRSLSPSNGANAGGPGNGKLKMAKNEMLEEGLMWEFSWVLHMVPQDVAMHLDRIRILAAQMEADKAFGLQSDWTRRKKWDADVRGEVLMLVVAKMEEECLRHSVDAWAREISPTDQTDAQRKRQRGSVEVEDGVAARFMKRRDVPTPPSSRGSREGSADGDESQP